MSSEKENVPGWILGNNLAIPIGVLEDLPNVKKPCYAMVNHIQVVSKKRLNSYGNKRDGYIKLKLTNDQMKLIDDAILENFIYHKKEST